MALSLNFKNIVPGKILNSTDLHSTFSRDMLPKCPLEKKAKSDQFICPSPPTHSHIDMRKQTYESASCIFDEHRRVLRITDSMR